MPEYAPLIQELSAELEKFDYIKEENDIFPSVRYISYIKKPRPLKVRNLVAVLDMPSEIIRNFEAKNYFQDIRSRLLMKYGDAFLWKELEICFVVLCEHNLYGILNKDEGKAVSQAGFSLNSMMGTCFINKTTFENFSQSTWGIYFSGDHYTAIRKTVDQWCKQKRNK